MATAIAKLAVTGCFVLICPALKRTAKPKKQEQIIITVLKIPKTKGAVSIFSSFKEN
jgi:hypothetical protein